MRDYQAQERGYQYTGIYSRSAGEVRERLEKIRKLGYKAVFVTVPDSPYSKG